MLDLSAGVVINTVTHGRGTDSSTQRVQGEGFTDILAKQTEIYSMPEGTAPNEVYDTELNQTSPDIEQTAVQAARILRLMVLAGKPEEINDQVDMEVTSVVIPAGAYSQDDLTRLFAQLTGQEENDDFLRSLNALFDEKLPDFDEDLPLTLASLELIYASLITTTGNESLSDELEPLKALAVTEQAVIPSQEAAVTAQSPDTIPKAADSGTETQNETEAVRQTEALIDTPETITANTEAVKNETANLIRYSETTNAPIDDNPEQNREKLVTNKTETVRFTPDSKTPEVKQGQSTGVNPDGQIENNESFKLPLKVVNETEQVRQETEVFKVKSPEAIEQQTPTIETGGIGQETKTRQSPPEAVKTTITENPEQPDEPIQANQENTVKSAETGEQRQTGTSSGDSSDEHSSDKPEIKSNKQETRQPIQADLPVKYSEVQEPVKAEAPVRKALEQSIVDQIVKSAELKTAGAGTTLELELNPKLLGKLSIILTSTPEGVTAKIKAGNDAVRAMLSGSVSLLEDALKETGISMKSIEVTSSDIKEDLARNSQSFFNQSGQDGRQSKVYERTYRRNAARLAGLQGNTQTAEYENSLYSVGRVASQHDGGFDYRA